ncbi:HEAT repeat domain-containing protein [Terracoccus sp. 273MFTsu3.1]|uniref:HEAT repeat domain-containing protein n=1 Tax=Terracoccus sp. 273MFTsu3.1 TaxID=1172188 RepID=UPI0003804D6B|nr:HEAT repeat domain-containing protein [Terracoccus sp. 273MFTsu3.1]
MVEPEVLRATPGDRARAAADALGDDVLTDWCADLLSGRATWGDSALPDIGWVGGQVVSGWGSPDHLDDDTRYWSRVWAARTLLYVWSERCGADVVAALGDPAWRVREMCAKVAARWELGPAAETCADLVTTDAVPRVRVAAARVLAVTGEGEHADALHEALDDPDESVRVAAARALSTLERRLDRDL